jgi:hypothetical protein
MRHRTSSLLLIAAITAANAGAARAFLGPISIFSDTGGTNCLVTDHQPGMISLYIVQRYSSGAVASQFRVETSDGFTGVYVSHSVAPGFLDLGSPPDDYSVSYSGCVTGDFLVATLIYQGFGTSAACSHIEIRPAPTSPVPGEIAIVDCSSNLVAGTTFGPAVVNYQGECLVWCIGAVESSTWGKIKAMYR